MSHNRNFGMMGDKIGGSLPPIAIMPVTGLVPWIQLETQVKPREVELEGLATETEGLITVPNETGSAGAGTMVEV